MIVRQTMLQATLFSLYSGTRPHTYVTKIHIRMLPRPNFTISETYIRISHFVPIVNTVGLELDLYLTTFLKLYIQYQAVVAEWLRRLTRNQIPSGSVGSNPTDCEIILY